MMDEIKTLLSQMLTPGTSACTIFGTVVGLVFAVLCLTIGVGKALLIALFCLVGAFIGGVKDKKALFESLAQMLHREKAEAKSEDTDA